MPILDAEPLNREDEDALRGILGPIARPPIYARQMREAARRAGASFVGSAEAEKLLLRTDVYDQEQQLRARRADTSPSFIGINN